MATFFGARCLELAVFSLSESSLTPSLTSRGFSQTYPSSESLGRVSATKVDER